MSEASVKPVSMKCKICGGDLANDYMLGACVCENCGNRWSLADLIPNYKDYSRIIEKLNKAKELLADGADEAQSGQALILYKSAEADCLKFTDAIASDLLKLCNKGQEDAKTAKIYASGKSYLEKENFRKAFSEFEKIRGYKDTEILIPQCEEGIKIQRKKRIPYAVIVGMILPAILGFFLHEKAGLNIPLSILVFAAGSALLFFVIYMEGTLSVIVEIFSFLLSVPLILYMILAYGFHMAPGTAVKLAVGIPVAVVAVIAVLAERKQ